MKKLDLHGLKVHDAWKQFNDTVELSYAKGFKKIIVITGHGKMSEEIKGWVNGNPLTVAVEQDRHNTGSFLVKLKKNQQKQTHDKPTTKPSRLATPEDLARLVAKFNN
jgi:DNA-nicking Smr family endonuclease